ncbi:MAG: hypothetical protein GY805_19505, partial [Chloroflexi bacterium]|nr:hypothetical protein [Chloroflexota bacterium]
KSDTLPIPDLAVGRLVETPDQVITILDAYLSTADGIISAPSSALVTGYDFLEDSANAITVELESGLGTSVATLITPRDLAPTDPATWTANDLRGTLLSNRYDLTYLAGHFSASSALAADYSTRIFASELAESTVDMTNSIVFSAGCHSGYNIVDDHGIPGITAEPDWSQAFATKGATLIAGTGYQYGDTDFIEYSERLYLEFSQELRAGNGPVAIGQALVAAKQTYLVETQEIRPLHEKSLLEATLFGLPMLKIDMPAGRGATSAAAIEAPIVSTTTPFSSNPGLTLGLTFADVSLEPDVTLVNHGLDVVGGEEGETVTASYLTAGDGVIANTAEPVLPVESFNVGVADTVLRGVGFRGGAFSDLSDILPLTGAATTEIRGVHPPFVSNVFYPTQPYQVNYFGQLVGGMSGAVQLNLTPAQFLSDNAGSLSGTLRQYDSMDFRLYYSDYIAQSAVSGNVPALAAPPTIAQVDAFPGVDEIAFQARVVGDPSAGIQEVWVTYTGSEGMADLWQSLDLIQSGNDSSIWTATLPLNGIPAADVRFIVQAANGVGLVSAATNQGAYYSGMGTTGADLLETAVSLQSPPTSGAYGTEISASALLTEDGDPVANQFVSFRVGAQQRTVLTNASGVATAELALLGLAGDSELAVIFGGNLTYQPSFDTVPFTISKAATVLTLEPEMATVEEGAETPFVVTLTDAGERPFGEKTVFYIISGDNGSYVEAVITDFAGRAPLINVPLPVGEYTVDVYFSGTIPLPNGDLSLPDDRYLPATVSGSLSIIEPEDGQTLYLSTSYGGEVDGIAYDGEDILGFDLNSSEWSLLFDGSDVGLAYQNVTAFAWLEDGSLLLTVANDFYLSELDVPARRGGKNVDNSDILRFIPETLGEETAGSWELYFDGSDVSLRSAREAIDALTVLPDGRLVISTKGMFKADGLITKSRGLVAFTPTSLGEATVGSWEIYFAGFGIGRRSRWEIYFADYGIGRHSSRNNLNITAVHQDNETGALYLVTTLAKDQVQVCSPAAPDEYDDCTFTVFWDGVENGLDSCQIDAIVIR